MQVTNLTTRVLWFLSGYLRKAASPRTYEALRRRPL